jgi:hypothetical protein
VGADGLYAKDFLLDSLALRLEKIEVCSGATLTLAVSDEYESERYTVHSRSDGVSVIAGSRLALLWAVCRIVDLWSEGCIPEVNIDDKPDVPMRGFHMGLPERSNFPFFKKLIRYVMVVLNEEKN